MTGLIILRFELIMMDQARTLDLDYCTMIENYSESEIQACSRTKSKSKSVLIEAI